MTTRVLVVAGTGSGVGKTTVTLGLLEAYGRRGLVVQAFKVGPDFIDPGLHAVVTGRPSYNLDGWMCGREGVLATVRRHAADADLAIVEGVMGCFDGADATGEDGSTAQVAKWLNAPVVLVIDVSGQSRSAAAIVTGFERFDPALEVAAVIANRVGSDLHARWIAEAIRSRCRAVPVGAIPSSKELTLPERHLGLVTATEGVLTENFRSRLAETIEHHIDLDKLFALALPLRARALPAQSDLGEAAERRKGGEAPLRVREALLRVGIARDVAFQFYYEENLALLRTAGAELVFWSPLSDAVPDADGFYFGGGYPELHAQRLANNTAALKTVRELAERGTPIYAECGGLMYLADALEDLDGVAHPMVGVLPTTVRMRPRRMTLGYREVRFTADNPLGVAGTVARGHEFHYSTLDAVPEGIARVWSLEGRHAGGERAEGYVVHRALISYVHLHFASNPELPRAFVAACEVARRGAPPPFRRSSRA
jgi:cobyrinic acid a,c-diamide synthase